MRKSYLFYPLLLVYSCYTTGKTYSVKQQNRDFQILKTTLLDNTAKPYLYTDSVTLQQTFSAVEKELQSPKSSLELFRLFSQPVNQVRCGHTSLFVPGRATIQYFSGPVTVNGDVWLLNERLYARTPIGRDPRIEKGNEIIAINGKNIPAILDDMRAYCSSDGYNNTLKDRFLNEVFFLFYYVAYGPSDQFTFDFISSRGDTLSTVVKATPGSLENFRSKTKSSAFFVKKKKAPKSFGSLKIDKVKNCAILKLPSFRKAEGKAHELFIDNCMNRVNRSDVEFLVIDLRGNLGGRIQRRLMGYLCYERQLVATQTCYDLEKPVYNKHIKKWWNEDYRRYKKHMRTNRRNGLAKERNYYATTFSPHKKITKKIIVITNGMTFSAGGNLAAILKEKRNAVIVGETTGGSYEHLNTGTLRMKLPETKMTFIFNPIYSNNGCHLTYEEKGLPPDIAVTETPGWKTKDDPYLKAVYDYIEKNQQKKPIEKKKGQPVKQP